MFSKSRFMRVIAILFLIVAIAWTSTTASAKIGTIDAVPAATLLLPYFEVDLGSSFPNGLTTTISITNTSNSNTIARVILWTDWSILSFGFNVPIDAQSTVTLNLADVFAGVNMFPGTADEVDFETVAATLKLWHTGSPYDPGGGFKQYGQNYGDDVARGYITADVVGSKTNLVPGNVGYFVSGGLGIAKNDNILWGEYKIIHPQQNYAHGETMVHIEASSSDARVTTVGNYTFYGTRVGANAADNREALASNWSIPIGGLTGNLGDSVTTDIIYWRDTKATSVSVNPGNQQAWYPLDQASLDNFDVDGTPWNPVSIEPFPVACGKVRVDSNAFPGVSSDGSILLNTNSIAAGTNFGTRRQSFFATSQTAEGRFSTGFEATALNNVTVP
jgi:hypothetical protein